MNILIIEDEYLLADELEETLQRLDPTYKVLDKLESIEESVYWLNHNSCDLIFMDIQLSDGLSFSIFDKVKVESPVIFTTAYDQYAIDAFNVNGIAYILKPIDEDEIVKALEKHELLKQSYLRNVHNLIDDYNHKKDSFENQQVLTIGSTKRVVNIESIAYFQAEDRYVFAILKSGQRMFSNKTLKELEKTLNPNLFFRINRTFIIQKSDVKEWMSYSKGRIKVILESDTDNSFIVSRARNKEFQLWIKK